MKRPHVLCLLALGLTVTLGCGSSGPSTRNTTSSVGGSGGDDGTAGAGGSGGTGGGAGGNAGTSGTGGTGGSGGSSGTGGTGGSGDDASIDVDASGGDDANMSLADGPTAADAMVASGDAGKNGPGPGVVPLPGKTGDYICPHDATHQQCCQMLCECVNRICADSPKAKPGLANCMSTCLGLSDMLTRCHVYHCYESVSPSGIKDHDSHCGHAANQVNGGGCPTGVLP